MGPKALEEVRLSSGATIWEGKFHRGVFGRHGREKLSEIIVNPSPFEYHKKSKQTKASGKQSTKVPGSIEHNETIDFKNRLPDDYIAHVVARGSPIKAFIDPPGTGHGRMATIVTDFILDKLADDRQRQGKGEVACFRLNSSFAWELDTAFSVVSGLYDDSTAYREGRSRSRSTDEFFQELERAMKAGEPMKRALFIIINGADRFFDPAGYPLSNELDLLIRNLPGARQGLIRKVFEQGTGMPNAPSRRAWKEQAKEEGAELLNDYVHLANGGLHPVTLMLFGSRRVGRYLESLGFDRGDLGINGIGDYDIISGGDEPFESSEPEPGYFQQCLASLHEKAHPTPAPVAEPMAVNPFAGAADRKYPSLHFTAIDTAYIDALIIPPGVATDQAARAKARAEFNTLVPLSLRTDIARTRDQLDDQRRAFFAAYLDARLLDHPTGQGALRAATALEVIRVMAFLGQPVGHETLCRAMVGANRPLSEKPMFLEGTLLTDEIERLLDDMCKLKLIREVAQFPEIAVDNRRFGLHRALLHEIRDRNSVPMSVARNYTSFNVPLMTAQPIDDHEPEERVQRALACMVDELIKPDPEHEPDSLEYGLRLRAACASMRSYYTTSVMVMNNPVKSNPELLEHAERIGNLIHHAELAADKRREAPGPIANPPVFFPDDLVWLHAQRGVALMATGDLYGARDSYRKARAVNGQFVEFGEHGQNWRRVQINAIQLDIERAKIGAAETKIRNLKQSVMRAVPTELWEDSWYVRTGEKKPQNAFEAIMQAYGSEQRLRVRDVDPHFPADLILTTALACGFRGWCEYLRGRLRTSEHYYRFCIQILRNTGETRAYAYFGRRYVQLLFARGDDARAHDVLSLCRAAADSARQLDISHLAALTYAERRQAEAQGPERAVILHGVMDSLRYAVNTEMYRVRMEARRVLAVMRLQDGDYDGALEQASEALATAARFGHTLRKVDLRILIGQILIKRGDPISGTSMLDQASRIADRLGYQRAVEAAHRVRMAGGGDKVFRAGT